MSNLFLEHSTVPKMTMLRVFFVISIAMSSFAAEDSDKDPKLLFEDGQKKALSLGKKLSRRKLSLEKGDKLPGSLQEEVDAIVDLFTKSAEAGYAEAQHALGGMYNVGYMVKEKNDALAIEYFTAAANQGKPESLSNLATMYKDGVGVERDIPKALELFEKAFVGGHETAAFNMASLYATGAGGHLEVNLQKAQELLSAIPNFEGASEALSQVTAMIKQQSGEL